MVVPFLIALIVGSWFLWQFYEDHRRESSAYSRAELALRSGDFVGALDAFAEAGSYRDAAERRLATQTELAPVRTAYLDALASLDNGQYEAAIDLLTPIHEAYPGYENVEELLESSRSGLLHSLERDVELAIARRNWMEADHLLERLSSLDPDNPIYPQRLLALRSAHAPIIFVRSGHLYQIGPDLADEKVLFDEFQIAAPSWSPDRRKIAFYSAEASRSQTASLFVLDYSTGEVTLISEQASPDPFVAWKPDSTSIAFVSYEITEVSPSRDRTYLTIYNLANGQISPIHPPKLAEPAPGVVFLTDVTSPSWSPDGDQIAYIAIRRPNAPVEGITSKVSSVLIADVNTGMSKDISERLLPAVAAVAWSPTSAMLLAWEAQGGTVWFESSETAIHLIDLTNASIERLTLRTEVTGRPVWAPDGEKFAVVMGSNFVRIRWLPGKREFNTSVEIDVSGHLTWSPDGNDVIAVSSDSSKPSMVISIDSTGFDQRTLPIAFDGNWPNVGLHWGPRTPPAAFSSESDVESQPTS